MTNKIMKIISGRCLPAFLLMLFFCFSAAQAAPENGEPVIAAEMLNPADKKSLAVKKSLEIKEEYRKFCIREGSVKPSWADKTHLYLSENVCGAALWFDSFFADERDVAENVDRYVRVIGSTVWDKEDGFDASARITARMDFPWFKKKLHLLLENESESDARDVLSGGTDSKVGDPTVGLRKQPKETTLSLRWHVLQERASAFSLRAGLRVSPSSPGVRLKARYRYTYGLGERMLARFTQQVFWHPKDQFGENSRVDLERLLTPRNLLRWSLVGGKSQENSDGFEWTASLNLFRNITRKKAFSVGAWVSGHTEPRREMANYGFSARYRQNVYRKWLFLEVEPSMSWRVDEAGDHYEPTPAIIFRVEMQFGRKEGD